MTGERTTATPKPTPPYSFDNSVTPPPLIQTGEDREKVLRSLVAYMSWLNRHHPDVRLAYNIAAPASEIRRAFTHDLSLLKRTQRRLCEVFDGPTSYKAISTLTNVQTERVVQHLRKQVVVNRDGSVHDSRSFEHPTTSYVVLMARLSDRKWYLVSVHEEPGDPS